MIVKKENGSAFSVYGNDTYVFFDILKMPEYLFGLDYGLCRIPNEVGEATSGGVKYEGTFPVGGRIRLKTDSPEVILRACMEEWEWKDCWEGRCDIYCYNNGEYTYSGAGCFLKTETEGSDNIGELRFHPWWEGMREIEINLLPYHPIKELYVGFKEGSAVEKGTPYKYKDRVFFYGSSIVHGVGSSRPGLAYPSVISKTLETDYVNLGFAGCARAEIPIMEHISKQKMSVFVYDYDHNCDNENYLRETHYRGYEIFRKAQPDTPVIMASKVDWHNDRQSSERRRQIIIESYNKGIFNGDKNLYFVDGKAIYGEYFADCTADGCHPNDAGYLCMAKAFGQIIRNLIK